MGGFADEILLSEFLENGKGEEALMRVLESGRQIALQQEEVQNGRDLLFIDGRF